MPFINALAYFAATSVVNKKYSDIDTWDQYIKLLHSCNSYCKLVRLLLTVTAALAQYFRARLEPTQVEPPNRLQLIRRHLNVTQVCSVLAGVTKALAYNTSILATPVKRFIVHAPSNPLKEVVEEIKLFCFSFVL